MKAKPSISFIAHRRPLIAPRASRLRSRGAALPLVLFFVLCAFLTSSIYMFTQLRIGRPAFRQSVRLQALLNARSGIWLGMNEVSGMTQARPDTGLMMKLPASLNTADSSAKISSAGSLLAFDKDENACRVPFSDSAFGTCSLSIQFKGCFLELVSTGMYRDVRQTASVLLGAHPFSSPDTVLYCETAGMPEGGGIDGIALFAGVAIDSGRKRAPSPYSIDPARLRMFTAKLTEEISGSGDSGVMDIPRTVRSARDFDNLPDIVTGSVIFESSFGAVNIVSDRRITIMGNAQFQGDTRIARASFSVSGDILVGDKAELRDVNLFSQIRIFFSGQSRFSGSAVAMGDVEIYESAEILSKSTIVCLGSVTARDTKKSPFSTHVRDRAIVDGIIIDANASRGLETESMTDITGIVWAQGKLCHEGKLSGVARARTLVSRDAPDDQSRNVLRGTITGLDNIMEYALPFFIGKTAIIAWLE